MRSLIKRRTMCVLAEQARKQLSQRCKIDHHHDPFPFSPRSRASSYRRVITDICAGSSFCMQWRLLERKAHRDTHAECYVVLSLCLLLQMRAISAHTMNFPQRRAYSDAHAETCVACSARIVHFSIVNPDRQFQQGGDITRYTEVLQYMMKGKGEEPGKIVCSTRCMGLVRCTFLK